MIVCDAKDPILPAIANKVTKKCSGLPLLLVIVTTDLLNKQLHAWEDKLKQLSEFDN